jgi:hypothetical protein
MTPEQELRSIVTIHAWPKKYRSLAEFVYESYLIERNARREAEHELWLTIKKRNAYLQSARRPKKSK